MDFLLFEIIPFLIKSVCIRFFINCIQKHLNWQNHSLNPFVYFRHHLFRSYHSNHSHFLSWSSGFLVDFVHSHGSNGSSMCWHIHVIPQYWAPKSHLQMPLVISSCVTNRALKVSIPIVKFSSLVCVGTTSFSTYIFIICCTVIHITWNFKSLFSSSLSGSYPITVHILFYLLKYSYMYFFLCPYYVTL